MVNGRRDTFVAKGARKLLARDALLVMGSRLAVLSERPFRLLWTARTVSATADAMLPAAVAFAVVHGRGSAADIGIVLGALTFSQLALSLVGGVWGDRLPRRLVVLGCSLVQTATLSVVAILLWSGGLRTWELLVASLIYGAARAFILPALTGLVAETVSAPRLQEANALIGLSYNLGYTGGPAAAGLLAAIAGPGAVFAINALGCGITVLCLAQLRLPELPRTGTSSFLRDMAAGWRELLARPWYLLNICAHGLWNFGIAAFWVLGPVVAAGHLGGPAAWGAISAGGTAGAFLGGLVALRWTPRRPLVVANLALALSASELLALVGPSPLLVVIGAAFVSGAGLTFLNVAWDTTLQQIIPEQALSRVSACDWLVSFAPVPGAYALVGPVSAAAGIGPALVGAAIVLALPCALVVLLPGVRGVRSLADGRIVDGRLFRGVDQPGYGVSQVAPGMAE
jgi:Major Facilitator Superfamily